VQYVQYWEYACPAWHNSLTGEQSYRIESIQKHAVKIIYGHYCTDYDTTCSQLNICSLENHRSDLSKSFFRKSVMDPKSCLRLQLHYLLPEPRGDFVDKLRRPLPLVPPTAKTNRCHN